MAVAVALAAFAPTLIWNARNGWQSFAYQGVSRFKESSFEASQLYKFPISQLLLLTPAVCVAAPRATGDCFDASSVPAGLRVGECVVVRYTPSDVPGRLARVRKIQKEPCS